MNENHMQEVETYSDEEWFESYKKERTQACARTSLRVFDFFCQKQTSKSKDFMISKYKNWF